MLRGNFVQSRQIAGFRRPVECSGDFVVARGEGLLWHTQKPFESLLSVSRARLRVTNGKGGTETTLDAKREPMLRTLNEILQSVVIADVAALRTRFDLTIKLVGANDWEMALQPKDAALRARFSAITLAGGRACAGRKPGRGQRRHHHGALRRPARGREAQRRRGGKLQ